MVSAKSTLRQGDYATYPHGRSVQDRDRYAPRLFPRSKRTAGLMDSSQAHAVASAPGFKVIEAPDMNHVTYLIAALTLAQFKGLEVPRTLGVATGGTFEPARYALGQPDFMRNMFGMALPVDMIPYVGTLDDYAQSKETYLRLEREIGTEMLFLQKRQLPWTYRGEQCIWTVNAGFDPQQLISPPIRYHGSGVDAARRFDGQLSRFVRPTRVQFSGAGIHGHYAFRERTRGLHPSMMFTDMVSLHLSTRVTNGNNFVPLFNQNEPPMHSMFRNIMAAYGLSTEAELMDKLEQLKRVDNVPKELDYVSDAEFSDFMDNLDAHVARMRHVTGRMPQDGITQGLGGNTSDMHLNAQTGDHKRLAALHSIEGPVDGEWPASFLQMNRCAVVIIDAAAAKLLGHREHNFQFRPDDATETIIRNQFGSKMIEKRFWDGYTPRVVW